MLQSFARHLIVPVRAHGGHNGSCCAKCLPKINFAASLGMREVWPIAAGFLALTAVSALANPFFDISMDAQKWNKQA